ncbi:mechanosensitive ion channel domain-containing protein [Methanolobus sp. ZRKC3]|uniref:mechanosensitive ion channel family protein n=1 Tax=Methanolobus sp. ZRKC3 TaxID=3125786 RepID=UPI003246B533
MILEELAASIIVLIVTTVLILGLNYLFEKRSLFSRERIVQQLIIVSVMIFGIIFAIFALPISIEDKNLILTLVGIVIGAVITFASTTFVANAMSGVMVRLINPFKLGDFIKIDETFGRVTEINFLHTQIQSIDRDLITIPNRTLVSNPLKTIRASGTIITTSVSLGYNIPRKDVEKSLFQAAQKSELETPFVHVTKLGDFSVSYTVGGLLKDVESLITARSNFKKNVMDSLHDNEIEIVSPTFMNQRVYSPEYVCMPPAEIGTSATDMQHATEPKTEDIIFDKAIKVQVLEQIYSTADGFPHRRKEIEEKIKILASSDQRDKLTEKMAELHPEEEELKHDVAELKELPDITAIKEDIEKEKIMDLIIEVETKTFIMDEKFKFIEERLEKLLEVKE